MLHYALIATNAKALKYFGTLNSKYIPQIALTNISTRPITVDLNCSTLSAILINTIKTSLLGYRPVIRALCLEINDKSINNYIFFNNCKWML